MRWIAPTLPRVAHELCGFDLNGNFSEHRLSKLLVEAFVVEWLTGVVPNLTQALA
jgi:hypothetical protein